MPKVDLLWGGVIFIYFQFVKLFEQIETWNLVHRQVLSYIWRFCKKCEYFLWIFYLKGIFCNPGAKWTKKMWDFCKCWVRMSSEVIVYFNMASIWSFLLIGENGGIFWKECSRFHWKFHASAAWRMPLMESAGAAKWLWCCKKTIAHYQANGSVPPTTLSVTGYHRSVRMLVTEMLAPLSRWPLCMCGSFVGRAGWN